MPDSASSRSRNVGDATAYSSTCSQSGSALHRTYIRRCWIAVEYSMYVPANEVDVCQNGGAGVSRVDVAYISYPNHGTFATAVVRQSSRRHQQ